MMRSGHFFSNGKTTANSTSPLFHKTATHSNFSTCRCLHSLKNLLKLILISHNHTQHTLHTHKYEKKSTNNFLTLKIVICSFTQSFSNLFESLNVNSSKICKFLFNFISFCHYHRHQKKQSVWHISFLNPERMNKKKFKFWSMKTF
jgi:hypothetical protein